MIILCRFKILIGVRDFFEFAWLLCSNVCSRTIGIKKYPEFCLAPFITIHYNRVARVQQTQNREVLDLVYSL
jgi:hypothetical protein